MRMLYMSTVHDGRESTLFDGMLIDKLMMKPRLREVSGSMTDNCEKQRMTTPLELGIATEKPTQSVRLRTQKANFEPTAIMSPQSAPLEVKQSSQSAVNFLGLNHHSSSRNDKLPFWFCRVANE